MINPQQVFVADAKPALAQPSRRSAYIFGATTPLGEILLNQVLANPAYAQVYIATTAALPSTVVHLNSFLAAADFVWQDSSRQVDCFFIVQPAPTADRLSRTGVLKNTSNRHAVYASVYDSALPAGLRQVSAQVVAASADMQAIPFEVRVLVFAPEASVATTQSWLSSYASHIRCMSYSGDGDADSKALKSAYRFEAQSNKVGLLDRIALMLLNTISNAAHGMLAGKHKTPITRETLIQRLLSKFETLSTASYTSNISNISNISSLISLTREDLLTAALSAR